MKLATIWPAIAFSLQIAVLVTARHLPYDDDLQADSLVLVNKTRRDISVEGSGDDDFHEIKPMPRGLITMERMEAAPPMESIEEKHEHADDIETLQDEGSGSMEAENPKTEPIIERIDEVFKEEEGMKEVIESITSQDATNLQTNDHNRHENTLNVIAGEENSPMSLEEPDLIKHALTDDETETGSGDVPVSSDEKNSEVEELVFKGGEHALSGELDNLESVVTENIQPTTDQSILEEHSESSKNLQPVGLDQSIVEEHSEPSESLQPVGLDKSIVEEHSEPSEIQQPVGLDQSAVDGDAESTTTEAVSTVTQSELAESTSSAAIEEIKPETSVQPDELTGQYLPLENDTIEEGTSTTAVPIAPGLIETSSSAPVIPTSSELPITTEITPEENAETTTVLLETSPETILIQEQDETTIETITNDITTQVFETDAEEINGTVLIPAVIGETIQVTAEAPAPQLEPKASSIGWYYVIGLLAVCLVILIAVVALRNRKRGHKLRTDIGPDRDTEKSLLSNGRFKEDSEDNNVKNNEIDPLVIKQNSQINKFEKSPNFSSPKNLNVQAQDKNIEKDNVLKSTQAIIEDEVDDAKKEVDDEKLDEQKKAAEELSPLIAEKVVVRTHVDLDSIPRKPIVINNRNGHSYLAVPGGETKT